MTKLYAFFWITLILIFLGCQKDNDTGADPSNKLLGHWTNPQLVDTLWKYDRVGFLPQDDYGFSFSENNTFIENKNSGWCGTPPISYRNFDGIWHQDNASLTISVGYWGGTAYYRWWVISVSNSELIVYKEEETFNGR
jgi:hypothetical protein